MPPAILAVATAAIAASAAYSAGIVIFGAVLLEAGMLAAVVAGAATLAFSFASQYLFGPSAGKPGLEAPSFAHAAQDRLLTVRQAIGEWRIGYGTIRVGGFQTFLHVTGDSNEFLHMVVTCLGNRVRGFRALMLDDEIVPLDEDGNATGNYEGFVTCVFGLGTTAGDSDFMTAVQSNCSDKWTSSHKQTGRAKVYLRFKYDRDKFPGNLPNPSFIVDAYDTIEDPRTDATGFTDNPALVIAHYLQLSEQNCGVGATADEIDEDALIAAANACDEMVSRNPDEVDTAFTVDVDSNLVTLADGDSALRLGTRLTVESTGGLPEGLSGATNYFWIPVGILTGYFATSLANARAGTAIDITTAGTGTHSLIANAEPRYTLNGSFQVTEDPEVVLKKMLSAMAGALTYAGGKWRIHAGVYQASSLTIGKDMLDGPIKTQTRRSRRDLFNGVKGVFSNPDDNYQPVDYPPVQKAAYLTEDNEEEIWRDLPLEFTNSPTMAQRIARITLERVRRQITADWPCNLSAFRVQAMTTVALDNTLWGWSAKTFEVSVFKFVIRGDEAPRLGVDLTLSEIDENVFAWTPGTDESLLAPAPTTTLPNPSNVINPTALAIRTGSYLIGSEVLYQLLLSWELPLDQFVVSGGTIEVQTKLSSASTWTPSYFVDGGVTQVTIPTPVLLGSFYDIRIRSVNGLGRRASTWQTEEDYEVGSTVGGVGGAEDDGLIISAVTGTVDDGLITDTGSPQDEADDGAIV